MAMYCPKCFNNSLTFKSRGVVQVVINGKQMDAGRFLFNRETTKQKQLEEDLFKKLEEFFKWYHNFKNQDPIETVQLTTVDVGCENGCAIPLNNSFSVVDHLFPKKVLADQLAKLGEKYNVTIELKDD